MESAIVPALLHHRAAPRMGLYEDCAWAEVRKPCGITERQRRGFPLREPYALERTPSSATSPPRRSGPASLPARTPSSIKGIRNIVQMLGCIPIPTEINGMRKFIGSGQKKEAATAAA